MSSPSVFGGPHTPERLMASVEDVSFTPVSYRGDKDYRGGFALGDDAMAMRMMSCRDPLYLLSEVLGKTLLRNPAPEHRRAADLLVAQRSFMLLHHRGSFKTTVVDEGGSIHRWLCDPDYRQLFLQASRDLGGKLSRQIREHFQSGKILRSIFPEYAIDTTEEAGQVMSFSVPCKGIVGGPSREASFTVGTPDMSLSMMHFDVIRVSDLSNETNNPPPCGRGTPEEAIKLQQWLGTMDGLLESKVVNPKAHKTFDGTRWSPMDVWSFIIENDPKNRIEKIISGVTTVDGKFVSSVPGFTHEILNEIREQPTMSTAMWAANYANDPVIGEGAMQFNPAWFRPYSTLDTVPNGMRKLPDGLDVGITVDPAWSEQDKNPEADRSAIVVSGVDSIGDLYVLAYRAGRWSPSALLDILYGLIAAWNPSWGVGIEGGTQSVALIETFRNELQRSFPFVPYRVLSPKGQNKLVRVVPLHTHAEKRGIYVKPGEHDELVQEFCKFPGGKYKDLVDALAYRAVDLIMPSMRRLIGEAPLPPNPRNLMTGQQVLDIINGRGTVQRMSPWDVQLMSGKN